VSVPAVITRAGDPVVERFLELVGSTGNSTTAARAVGRHRNAFYERAARDESFRLRWDAAMLASRQHIAQDILDKASVVSGRIVEERVLDANGDPVLDDDLEAVTVRRLVDYDSRILAKMVDKFVESADGPPTTNVLVQNVVPPERRRGPPPRPSRPTSRMSWKTEMQAGTPNFVVWQFVTPGGIATERFPGETEADATYDTARVCLGHVDDPHDGLIVEMETGRERVPWASARVKAEALERVAAMTRMPADQRARLLAHIRATPHFAD
jgi:hypothetical protein